MLQYGKAIFNGKIRQRLTLYRKQGYHDFLPYVTKKIFMPNPNRKKFIPDKTLPRAPAVEKTYGPRKNKLGIQMLSKAIYDQIFLEGYKEKLTPETLERCKQNLVKHNMITKDEDFLKDVDFKIPPLVGKNIEEHMFNIAEEQAKPYRDLVQELLKGIPNMPTTWRLESGWTMYVEGQDPISVPYPLEQAIVFDIEVCMMSGKAPTLATAVSSKAWYGWVSPALVQGSSKPVTNHQYTEDVLIPMESDNCHLSKDNRIVIGHNVSYDRARVKEQYWLKKSKTLFLDTMSLHVCVSGLTSYQRAVMKSEKFNLDDENWKNCSSLNSLRDVYNLYCGGKLSKQTRDLFVEGTLSDIKESFQDVMHYCGTDVYATYRVLENLFPLFLERFSHPATLSGILELGTAYLPVNNNWNQYISDAEQTYEDLEIEGRILLARRADHACHLMHDDEYEKDLWLWDQDWETKQLKMKKNVSKSKIELVENTEKPEKKSKSDEDEENDPLEKKFQYLWAQKDQLGKVKPLLPGYPNWYRKLCTKPASSVGWVPGPHLISTSMQITPKLLSLTWEGYPLHHLREKGWGFLVPFTDDLNLKRSLPLDELLKKCPLLTNKPDQNDGQDAMNSIVKQVDDHLMKKEFYSRLKQDKTGGLYKGAGIWCNIEIEDCCWFFKLPHKDGESYNVGNPLAKDFLNKFSENVLAGDTENAEKVLAIARMLSYWRNNRDRIMQQMVVWLENSNLPKNLGVEQLGAILPQIVVCGTLTRRAMEPTWMTASNAHKERVGSELRAMIQAPSGYSIVGADVDSQELWIASVLGDAHYAKTHGGTPFGWMTLSGTKTNGTDMHSVTAKAVGISRDHAKVINYARIYGAGQNFAERLLKQFNPSMSQGEARSKASKMFSLTKGKKLFYLKREFLDELADLPYTKWQAFDIAKRYGNTVDRMFHKSKWVDGTESAMFNRLEDIANDPFPKTPFLGSRLSRALEPKSSADDRYLPTRVNWVVQSGAVDFLHLMLVCMKWIMKDKVRFCLSFHDEVRYLVPDSHKYQAALAMHVTNLLTRAFCSYKLGLHDLPQSVAFFSSVEVDTCLRKESKQDCMTPSNPHGLENGYGIKQGESLDIYEAIQKARGDFTCWYDDTR